MLENERTEMQPFDDENGDQPKAAKHLDRPDQSSHQFHLTKIRQTTELGQVLELALGNEHMALSTILMSKVTGTRLVALVYEWSHITRRTLGCPHTTNISGHQSSFIIHKTLLYMIGTAANGHSSSSVTAKSISTILKHEDRFERNFTKL
jgi:hypothetical protein